jgi:anthranilate phosphoribosyltransferase
MKSLKKHLNKVTRGQYLTQDESKDVFELMLLDETSKIQVGALLASLATRGEAVEEILGIARMLQKQMVSVSGMTQALDITGTGGDGHDTINVSTLACFVCAYLGVPVVKYGTKSQSSKCGSFDLLEQLGIHIPKDSNEAKEQFKKKKITFLFAPTFHPILKKLYLTRRELGIRTIFNFIGPLLNPGNVAYQVIGVSKKELALKLGEVLMQLDKKHAVLVHGRDGLDEISVSALTDVYEYRAGLPMKHLVITPKNLYPIESIQGGNPEENAESFINILKGKGTNAENEFVALNAGLGLYTFGKVESIEAGRLKALEALLSGRVIEVFNKLLVNENKFMKYQTIGGNNKLDKILQDKEQELIELKKLVSLEELKQRAKNLKREIRDFAFALKNNSKVSLIAEIKKASPSLGDINTEVDIQKQARIYENAGVSAISVLTDTHFKGEIGFLEEVKKVTKIPILRKDFIFDEYQVYESYLVGADAILLIATVLDQKTLNNLIGLTHEFGMECLVETHTQEDMDKALASKAKIIGINARNLKTFEVSLDNILNLTNQVPKDRLLVAESGIETRKDVEKMRDAGARVILVGTTLMKAKDVSAKVRELCINL